MTGTVIEVGPQTVRGPGPAAPQELVTAAIECIDDRFALLGDRLVEVRSLWGEVLDVVAAAHTGTLALVFPTWWSAARIELVTDSARSRATEVVVLQRASILARHGSATVVEFSEDLVVISSSGASVTVLSRAEGDVAQYLRRTSTVVVDVPAGVTSPDPALTACLHAAAVTVAHSDRHRLLAAANRAMPHHGPDGSAGVAAHRKRRAVAVLAGVFLSVAAAGGGWAAQALSGQRPSESASTLLVEGRVAVRVPARWTVERITSGPGSARVRVSAPTGDPTALHITQSSGQVSQTLQEVAESLGRAVQSEPSGVFVDFDPDGNVGNRTAVTYRERRADSDTAWAVVIDGATRIAIGCQGPAARRDVIDAVCIQAVESAQVLP
ncbi:type VII secretion-associated protein [Mycolicibacterium hippocampi]|uniref:type VII secretion-associated protein n=1 Tax=Mycolicibacterium hippocampi TaxID=659824 RepID=UPI00351842FB